MSARILIVEDEEPLTMLLRYNLEAEGYEVDTSARGDEADTKLKETTPDLILLDHLLGAGERGTDFLPQLKEIAGQVPIVVISGSLNIRQQLHLLQGAGSADYVLDKPVDLDDLELTVKTALGRNRGG